MKNVFVLAFFLVSLPLMLNARNNGYYKMKLVNVEATAGKLGDFSTQENNLGIDYSTYKDGNVNISFTVHPTHVDFVLENISDKRIKLPWNDVIYVDFDGSSIAVFHSGVKYNDREKEQLPSTIVKGSKLIDIIAPKTYVEWGGRGWEHTQILNHGRRMNNGTFGNKMSISMPLEIEGQIIEYTFTFQAEWLPTNVKLEYSDRLIRYREIKKKK